MENIKYYVRFEFRYNETFIDEYGEEDYKYICKKITSELYSNIEDAINFANDVINKNRWIIQYVGYVNAHISKTKRLERVSFKKGGELFISLEKIEMLKKDDIQNVFDEMKLIKG